jgi:hypothetical protein
LTLGGTVAACAAVVGVEDWPDGGGGSPEGGSATTSVSVGGSSNTTGAASASTTRGTGGTGGTGGTAGAGGSDDSGIVPCGGLLCETEQVCCVATDTNTAIGCKAAGRCGADAEIACDGSDDCPDGSVCCGVYLSADIWQSVSCTSAAECEAASGYIMCGDNLSSNPAACSGMCLEAVNLEGYWFCYPTGSI